MHGQILRNPLLPGKPLTRFLYILNPGGKKKEYTARKLIGFSEDEMYSVVSDVRHYKQFLPFCTKSKILSSSPELLVANLEIGFPPIVENYTSRVALDRPRSVRAVCSDGRLFEHLETTWRFGPGLRSNPRTCITDFYIWFEFKSALYSNLATLFFDGLVKQMEEAFVGEAARRFGEASQPTHKLSPMPLKRLYFVLDTGQFVWDRIDKNNSKARRCRLLVLFFSTSPVPYMVIVQIGGRDW